MGGGVGLSHAFACSGRGDRHGRLARVPSARVGDRDPGHEPVRIDVGEARGLIRRFGDAAPCERHRIEGRAVIPGTAKRYEGSRGIGHHRACAVSRSGVEDRQQASARRVDRKRAGQIQHRSIRATGERVHARHRPDRGCRTGAVADDLHRRHDLVACARVRDRDGRDPAAACDGRRCGGPRSRVAIGRHDRHRRIRVSATGSGDIHDADRTLTHVIMLRLVSAERVVRPVAVGQRRDVVIAQAGEHDRGDVVCRGGDRRVERRRRGHARNAGVVGRLRCDALERHGQPARTTERIARRRGVRGIRAQGIASAVIGDRQARDGSRAIILGADRHITLRGPAAGRSLGEHRLRIPVRRQQQGLNNGAAAGRQRRAIRLGDLIHGRLRHVAFARVLDQDSRNGCPNVFVSRRGVDHSVGGPAPGTWWGFEPHEIALQIPDSLLGFVHPRACAKPTAHTITAEEVRQRVARGDRRGVDAPSTHERIPGSGRADGVTRGILRRVEHDGRWFAAREGIAGSRRVERGQWTAGSGGNVGHDR